MSWVFILLADVFEIAWPFALKWLVKYSRWSPLIIVIVASTPSMFLLGEALKRLPAGTVYAVFIGIGVAGTAIVGMLFSERAQIPRAYVPCCFCWLA
jgi:quaternary ammonium compound-resistance protein SugE